MVHQTGQGPQRQLQFASFSNEDNIYKHCNIILYLIKLIPCVVNVPLDDGKKDKFMAYKTFMNYLEALCM